MSWPSPAPSAGRRRALRCSRARPRRPGSMPAAARWPWRRDSSTSVGDGLVLQLLLLVALIVGSGLLSGAEAAYFSLGRARLRRIAAERPEGALAPVVSRPHDLLVTLLVGITVINIGAAALATHVAHFLFGPRWGLLVELIAMVVLLTTFGEVLPMTLAVKYPERFLAIVERPVRWLELLLAPIRGVLAGLTTLTVRLLGRGAA